MAALRSRRLVRGGNPPGQRQVRTVFPLYRGALAAKGIASCAAARLGYVPLSQTGAELLFEVFSQRYDRGSTLVTSNLPSSERLTGALLDRLTHHGLLRHRTMLGY